MLLHGARQLSRPWSSVICTIGDAGPWVVTAEAGWLWRGDAGAGWGVCAQGVRSGGGARTSGGCRTSDSNRRRIWPRRLEMRRSRRPEDASSGSSALTRGWCLLSLTRLLPHEKLPLVPSLACLSTILSGAGYQSHPTSSLFAIHPVPVESLHPGRQAGRIVAPRQAPRQAGRHPRS